MSLIIVNTELFRYLGLRWDVTISWLVIKMSMPEDISGKNLFSSFLFSEKGILGHKLLCSKW